MLASEHLNETRGANKVKTEGKKRKAEGRGGAEVVVVKNKSGIQKDGSLFLCRACVAKKLTFDDPVVANNGVAYSDICSNFSVSALVMAKKHFTEFEYCFNNTQLVVVLQGTTSGCFCTTLFVLWSTTLGKFVLQSTTWEQFVLRSTTFLYSGVQFWGDVLLQSTIWEETKSPCNSTISYSHRLKVARKGRAVQVDSNG